jgi:capsular polysaccharide biosynthesis protein
MPPAFSLGLCKKFNITCDDFIKPQTAMLLKNVVIPSKPYMHGQYISKTAKDIWREIGESYALAFGKMLPKKIYVTRKYIKKRSLKNEKACERLFERYGFTCIAPEKLELAEQIALFANASHVAGPMGSAMHSVIFSLIPANLKVLFLQPKVFPPAHAYAFPTPAYALLEAAFGRTPYHVFGAYPNRKTSRPGSSPWIIDINSLETAIKQWLDA